MLCTNYDRYYTIQYNTIHYNTEMLTIEVSPSSKSRGDDDEKVIYS